MTAAIPDLTDAPEGTWLVTGATSLESMTRRALVPHLREVFVAAKAAGMNRIIFTGSVGCEPAAVAALETRTVDGNEPTVDAKLVPYDVYLSSGAQDADYRPEQRCEWWAMLGRASHIYVEHGSADTTSNWTTQPVLANKTTIRQPDAYPSTPDALAKANKHRAAAALTAAAAVILIDASRSPRTELFAVGAANLNRPVYRIETKDL